MSETQTYHFKCAVERGRSSSGTILHDGFTAINYSLSYGSFYQDIKKLYPEGTYKTKLVIIDNAGDEIIWKMCDLDFGGYKFEDWLKSNFSHNDQIKLFIQSDPVAHQQTGSHIMPSDAQATSSVGETSPLTLTEQMDKILNIEVANSVKLEQLANRVEEIAEKTQQSFLEIKKKVEKLQLVPSDEDTKVDQMAEDLIVSNPTVKKDDLADAISLHDDQSLTTLEYYESDSARACVLN